MSSRQRLAPIHVVLTALIVAYCIYCYWPTVHADWFVIDDHDVIDKMGTANRLAPGHFFEALRTTEVNLSSTQPRYRLLYQPFLYLESIVYGKNVTLWYVERMAIACFLGIALFAAARRCFGLWVGFAFTLFELSNPYWGPGMFTRLGSGETYAVVGLSLIALAFCSEPRMRSWRSCALLSLGLIICVGAKENFLPFIILPIAVLFYARRHLSLVSKLFLSLSIAFTCWSGAVVAYRIVHASFDTYMRDTTVSARSRLALGFVQLPSVRLWLAAMLVATIVWLLRRSILRLRDEAAVRLAAVIVVNLICLGFYFTQFIFYNGDWPNDDVPRYLFPGLLVRDFSEMLLLVAFITAVASSRRINWRPAGTIRTMLSLQTWARAVIIVALAVAAKGRFSDNRYYAQAMARDSSRFMRIIHGAIDDLRATPDASLVIRAHSVGDAEPIVSISRFFRAFGGKNPVMLQIDEAEARKSFSFGGRMDQVLVDEMKRTETKGSGYIEPLDMNRLGACYSIGISGPKSSSCAKGVDYQVPWEG